MVSSVLIKGCSTCSICREGSSRYHKSPINSGDYDGDILAKLSLKSVFQVGPQEYFEMDRTAT
jgi:hypothetical protein